MKYLVVSLVLVLVALAACAPAQEPIDLPPEPPPPGDVPSDAELSDCQVDTDCVPLPTCHPQRCINKNFEDRFAPPFACTELFDETAAYTAEDCGCQEGLCVNLNAQ